MQEWRGKLATPIIADKSLQEMTDSEIEDYNRKVQEPLMHSRKRAPTAFDALTRESADSLHQSSSTTTNMHLQSAWMVGKGRLQL